MKKKFNLTNIKYLININGFILYNLLYNLLKV